jgi:hypothetical protein
MARLLGVGPPEGWMAYEAILVARDRGKVSCGEELAVDMMEKLCVEFEREVLVKSREYVGVCEEYVRLVSNSCLNEFRVHTEFHLL